MLLSGLDLIIGSGSGFWRFESTGVLRPNSAVNAQDIGGTSVPLRTGYFGTSVVTPEVSSNNALLSLSPGTNDIKWNKANSALGGGAAPTVGTIGGSGPAAAAQRNWLRFLESDGTASFIPVWR